MESQTGSPLLEIAEDIRILATSRRSLNKRSWMYLRSAASGGDFQLHCVWLETHGHREAAGALRSRVREYIDDARAVCQSLASATSEDHYREMVADFEGIAFSLSVYLLDFDECMSADEEDEYPERAVGSKSKSPYRKITKQLREMWDHEACLMFDQPEYGGNVTKIAAALWPDGWPSKNYIYTLPGFRDKLKLYKDTSTNPAAREILHRGYKNAKDGSMDAWGR